MSKPIAVRLDCPACGAEHACNDDLCTDLCGLRHTCLCGLRWWPFGFAVVAHSAKGPDAMVCYSDGTAEGFEGVGFYHYDLDHPDEGVSGPFLTLEDAARDAMGGFWRVRFDPEALVAAQGEVGVG